MPTIIDETELARLWALACAAGDADYSAHDDADDSTKYAAAACNAVPALVAEVRRLREALNKEHRAWQCADARGDWLEMENAALREKVAAWEWFGECQETYRKCFLNVTYRHNLLPCLYPEDVRKDAMQEMVDILVEAKEAVHVDRE